MPRTAIPKAKYETSIFAALTSPPLVAVGVAVELVLVVIVPPTTAGG